jgi:DNA-binding transcriptional ArsR family regulator
LLKQTRPKPSSATALSEVKHSAPIFAALGDQTRLRLVFRLCDDGPLSITRLAAGSKVTRQAITKHLRVMEQAGLVGSTRHGRESVWQLKQRGLKDAHHYLDLISNQWDQALGRLRKFVED